MFQVLKAIRQMDKEAKRHNKAASKKTHHTPSPSPSPPHLRHAETERSAKPGASHRPARIETYTLLKKLGSGGQGSTEIVSRRSDAATLVRKEQFRFECIRTASGSRIPTEMYIFETIISPCDPYSIVKFDHCNYTARGTQTLYFEWCEGGDVDALVRGVGKGRKVEERRVWECFEQMVDALAFLHYGVLAGRRGGPPPSGWRRVIHRDLKPANIFLRRSLSASGSQPWEFVLGDFGLATMEETTSHCGTGEWIGPEVPLMTAKGDVWSLGAVIHALCHGRSPCDDPPREYGKRETAKWWWEPRARRVRGLGRGWSSALEECMMLCLQRDPSRRWRSWELVEEVRDLRRRSRC